MTIAELVSLSPLVTREALEVHDHYTRGDYFADAAREQLEERRQSAACYAAYRARRPFAARGVYRTRQARS